ncbi:YdhK family protein [Enterococcus aquimarinus]|uniref:DUF1541 domain-containing protein n=1 Tax=Enterococcus aquimarinus TaxID=328396 RepID=A0A1L8QY07_9ENTE|nr:YdhK family protein [Enterococcus aquimarinus]OJG12380.1 hypothetical protein RU93_GL000310 [Enterococcus aquimarinus]
MKKNRILTGILSISAATLLVACSTDTGSQESAAESEASSIESMAEESSMSGMDEMEGNDMEGMVHDDSGEIPEGLKEAENPTYNVGETATITDGHMEGMERAEATIVGAFDTVAYEVSYDPTNGGPREENHKWVIHEEIADAGEEPFEPGDEVTLEANHMEGMEGATATIDDAKSTTVYMIDYQPTTGGEEVKNHKWVTDSELSAE